MSLEDITFERVAFTLALMCLCVMMYNDWQEDRRNKRFTRPTPPQRKKKN